ncbi:MAG: hypothetical protein SVC26_07480 [Pseudomonadota bacterium]|nr:hypothetical protein [Pseudomonadota bacterium]
MLNLVRPLRRASQWCTLLLVSMCSVMASAAQLDFQVQMEPIRSEIKEMEAKALPLQPMIFDSEFDQNSPADITKEKVLMKASLDALVVPEQAEGIAELPSNIDTAHLLSIGLRHQSFQKALDVLKVNRRSVELLDQLIIDLENAKLRVSQLKEDSITLLETLESRGNTIEPDEPTTLMYQAFLKEEYIDPCQDVETKFDEVIIKAKSAQVSHLNRFQSQAEHLSGLLQEDREGLEEKMQREAQSFDHAMNDGQALKSEIQASQDMLDSLEIRRVSIIDQYERLEQRKTDYNQKLASYQQTLSALDQQKIDIDASRNSPCPDQPSMDTWEQFDYCKQWAKDLNAKIADYNELVKSSQTTQAALQQEQQALIVQAQTYNEAQQKFEQQRIEVQFEVERLRNKAPGVNQAMRKATEIRAEISTNQQMQDYLQALSF